MACLHLPLRCIIADMQRACRKMCRGRAAEWAEQNQEYAFTEKDKGNKT